MHQKKIVAKKERKLLAWRIDLKKLLRIWCREKGNVKY